MASVRKCSSLLALAIITILGLSSTVSCQTQWDCQTTLTATGNAQNLTSPNYPSNYSSNANCNYVIRASSSSDVIVLKVLNFDLQGPSPSCTYDYVYIYDGPIARMQILCGQVSPTQFIGTDTFMSVLFRSDSSINNRGFSFEYTTVTKSALCENYTIFFNGTSQYITSPGYPYMYTSNLDCSWLVTADSPTQVAVLNLLDFSTQGNYPSCSSDYLAFYDGNTTNSPLIRKLCGRVSSTQIVSSGIYMAIVFHSASNYGAFKLETLSQNKSAFCYNSTLQATGNPNYLMSPNYPNNYTSKTGCLWTIRAASSSEVVVLKLLTFELESSASCIYDYLAVYDGSSPNFPLLQKQCGTASSLTFTSTGSYLTVMFHSDQFVESMGFKFEYTSQPKPAQCADVSLTASTSAKYFNSTANYPGQYPSNLDCNWFIKADSTLKVVVLDIKYFSIDDSSLCASDYVMISDGPSNYYSRVIATLCGSIFSGTYKSTGPDMTVVFHSDAVISDKIGFQFYYRSELPPVSSSPATIDYQPSSSTSSSSNLLPAYVVSPVFVAAVGLIGVVCCGRRKQKTATQMAGSALIVTAAPAPRPAPHPMPALNITANQNVSQTNVFFVTFESNNQAEAPTDTNPPRYSSLTIDVIAGSPPNDPRAMHLPPAYSEVEGGAAL